MTSTDTALLVLPDSSAGPTEVTKLSVIYLRLFLAICVYETSKMEMRFGRKKVAFTTGENLKSERRKANSQAVVKIPASRHMVIVDDYYATGARLSGTSPPPSRRDVCLNINGLVIFGTIVWRRENSFGFKFDQNLNDFDSAELQNALDEARIFAREFDRENVLKEMANKPSESGKKDVTGTAQQGVCEPR